MSRLLTRDDLDRLQHASAAVQAARVHTAGLTVARDDLRHAVRALAVALDDLIRTFRLTHVEELFETQSDPEPHPELEPYRERT